MLLTIKLFLLLKYENALAKEFIFLVKNLIMVFSLY